MEVVAESLELGGGGQLGDLDVHGGTEGSAQVGGAEGQVAETVTLGKGKAGFLHLSDSLEEREQRIMG